jgi:hypothetical protein
MTNESDPDNEEYPRIYNSVTGVSPTPNHYFIALTELPIIKKSSDGAKTFKMILLDDTASHSYLNSVKYLAMLNSDIGIALTSPYYYITLDGWKTYKKHPRPRFDSVGYGTLSNPVFIDSNFIIMGIGYNPYYPENKGYTKILKYNINNDSFIIISDLNKDSIVNRKPYASKIFFVNDSLGYIAGGIRTGQGDTDNDVIMRTLDGGYTWKTQLNVYKKLAFGLKDIAFYDAKNGVAVGTYGKIYLTNDSGNTWVFSEPPQEIIDSNNTVRIHVTWAGQHPIFGTWDRGIFRYEGNFFDFIPDSLKPIITAEDKDFGEKDIELQDSTFLTFKIYNNNNGNELKIFGYSALTNSAFSTNLPVIDSLNPLTIEPQGFFEYEVYFKPKLVKKYNDSIIFYSNAKKTDNIAYLSGEGIAFPLIQADNQDFKTKEIHDTTTIIKKIKIHNLSDYSDLNIFGFSQPTESAFTNQFVWLDSMTYITVKPNEYFELPVSFKPTEMRKYKDSIVVYSNATKQDSVIFLEGEGIDSTIGVVDNLITNYQLLIVPNPAGDFIEINFERCPTSPRCRTSNKIEIYNVLGECVKTVTIHSLTASHRMNTEDLPPGVYFVRIGEFVGMFVISN